MRGSARLLFCAAALAALALPASSQTAAPAVLAQAVAMTQAAKADYAFDLDVETSRQTWRARFEPGRTPRLRLLQPRLESLESDERRAFDRLAANMEGVSWCASEGMSRIGDVRLVREDEESATYSFQPTRDSVRGEQAQRFANRLRGEITLLTSSPDIARIRIYAPQAFSPLPLVDVQHVDVAITCQEAPNGRRYAAQTVTEVRGTAFGRRFDERSVQRARNLAAP